MTTNNTQFFILCLTVTYGWGEVRKLAGVLAPITDVGLRVTFRSCPMDLACLIPRFMTVRVWAHFEVWTLGLMFHLCAPRIFPVDRLQFTVTSRKEMPNARFAFEIERASEDLYELFKASAKKVKSRL